ncbi:hypothetical protein [Sporomusa acidovorans]|uniref:hypothetical protein n=1 Tax=Sporomusa acidovorans TaxID=112900 RepID=UPI0035A0BA55
MPGYCPDVVTGCYVFAGFGDIGGCLIFDIAAGNKINLSTADGTVLIDNILIGRDADVIARNNCAARSETAWAESGDGSLTHWTL